MGGTFAAPDREEPEMPDYSNDAKTLLARVDRHGWQATHVFDPDGAEPDFTYTVGLADRLKAPEIIVFGLSKSLMHSMLAEVQRQIAEEGLAVADGQHITGLLGGFDCIARRAIHPELFTEFAVSALWYWRDRGHAGRPEVMQIAWPSATTGLFPWDPGCAQSVIDDQPPLW